METMSFTRMSSGDVEPVVWTTEDIGIVEKVWAQGAQWLFEDVNGKLKPMPGHVIRILEHGKRNGGVQREAIVFDHMSNSINEVELGK